MRGRSLLFSLVSLVGLAACGDEPGSPSGPSSTPPPASSPIGPPTRIVSLDYCADQYVLGLVERERILALSPDATSSFSYHRDEAEGIRKVRPRAEDVLTLQPDLIVRTYGGGPQAATHFERAGVRVVQIGYVGRLDDVAQTIRQAGTDLAAPQRAEQRAVEVEDWLTRRDQGPAAGSFLYVTPGGATAGEGTLIDELMRSTGATNFVQTPGWPSLPLERLVRDTPDVIVQSFYDTAPLSINRWSAAGHPIVQGVVETRPVITVDSAALACPNWSLIDAFDGAEQDGA